MAAYVDVGGVGRLQLPARVSDGICSSHKGLRRSHILAGTATRLSRDLIPPPLGQHPPKVLWLAEQVIHPLHSSLSHWPAGHGTYQVHCSRRRAWCCSASQAWLQPTASTAAAASCFRSAAASYQGICAKQRQSGSQTSPRTQEHADVCLCTSASRVGPCPDAS